MSYRNNRGVVVKLVIGLALIAGVWWLVKCRCLSLEALTPAAIRDYIQSFGEFSVIVYIIAYAFNTISILPPIAPLSLSAGLAFGALWGALYLMLGAMLGTSATFIIARYLGRGLVEKILKGKFKDLDEKLAKNGFMTILFFRLIPLVPYEVLNYAGGLSRIGFKDYFLATFLGLIPGVVIAALFGGSLGEIRTFKDIFAPKFLIAIGLMALILAVPAVYQVIKKKNQRRR
ncbi:MAG: TVP38/TMEM64 family protein [Candidatus Omnitrophica bacterium]|nr:TVP38/TMEM64 family protein [Candidatus Omnitrophota bacterium]